MLIFVGVIVTSIIALAAGQFDPILNYCTRYDHQCMDDLASIQSRTLADPKIAVVKNSTLYIDGGKESFIPVNGEGKQEGDVVVGLSRYTPEHGVCRLTKV